MNQPPFAGPPPFAPLPPRHHEPQHVVHLILSLLTCGLWLIIWGLAALIASSENAKEHQRYERELAEYRAAYIAWQYGYPPA